MSENGDHGAPGTVTTSAGTCAQEVAWSTEAARGRCARTCPASRTSWTSPPWQTTAGQTRTTPSSSCRTSTFRALTRPGLSSGIFQSDTDIIIIVIIAVIVIISKDERREDEGRSSLLFGRIYADWLQGKRSALVEFGGCLFVLLLVLQTNAVCMFERWQRKRDNKLVSLVDVTGR